MKQKQKVTREIGETTYMVTFVITCFASIILNIIGIKSIFLTVLLTIAIILITFFYAKKLLKKINFKPDCIQEPDWE